MRGQEHTIMGYLAWAVFFVVAMGVVYSIFSNMKTATPTPMERIIDIFLSAKRAHDAGIDREVCGYVYPGGTLQITKEFIERTTGFTGNITFQCKAAGCESGADSITISGRSGQLCVEVSDSGMTVTWR